MPAQIEGTNERKIVAYTIFERTLIESKNEFEWTWVTFAMNDEPTGNSETFKNVSGALNGFLSQQGYTEWQPGQIMPPKFSGFQQVDKTGDKFRIDTYETV